jgi:TRAP-type C4-dicarboxylate transport system substrate-binding protein
LRACAAALLLALFSPCASAEPVTLRAATVAPEGSAWARELRALGPIIERSTSGRVRVKWYFNGVAGGELEIGERVRRGQLDMVVSGGTLCTEVMPTMRVLRLPGLFQGRDEAQHVMYKLQSKMAAEAREQGFVELGIAPEGADMFFLPRPMSTLAELRTIKLWQWEHDSAALAMASAMGLKSVSTPLADAARAFDDGRFEGFFAIPTAAMAFQWSVRAPFLLDLRSSMLFGCLLVSSSSFYGLAPEDQKALVAVTARLADRIGDVGLQQEAALLGGAFQHQGVKLVPASERLRAEFFAAAKAAQEREGPKVVPLGLIQQVKEMLADYRAEHLGQAR